MLMKAGLTCVGLALLGTATFQNPQVLVGHAVAEHNCLLRGQEVNDKPFVSYGCFDTDLEAKAVWKQNIRFLTEVFHAVDRLQCEPLMRSAEDYRDSGSAENRQALVQDLRTLSELLRLAAETGRLTGTYLPETAAASRDLERNYLWAATILDGPLSWTLPSEKAGMKNWTPALRTLIHAIRPTFEEHYRLTQAVLDECDWVEEDTFRVATR
ncbi:hypothetical protein [Methylobacterium oxalidis]|uniref:Uncharacterized protein n=1 Tax=Methylobacterium oxalidis TaxID=944322 RepID=A0A512JC73_9HYPH|nr:hypothetical protein [Methylobacterium oxalidis]GEP07529.1 hypothetical protein MOX02_55670 [Methylobacterium oxalidis]GJE35613.1 hypothetical protein LDDCCGHA_5832 [Methylobacterium oxalidis]GLS65765.1 hypothetical protein GCM10007888_41470 [Methylobacterium oxalidis]